MRKSVFVAGVLCLIIAGCGGGDSSPAPTPTPSPVVQPTPQPSPTPLPSVMAAASIVDGQVQVTVLWEPSPDIPQNSIIEYHVYRDDTLIGTTNQTQNRFVDTSARGETTVSYLAFGFDPTLLETRSVSVLPLVRGVPHSYRVSALFRLSNGFHVETAIGTSAVVNVP
ncbi:MAG: hypothetical protein H7Y38_13435 [Armatimonadetes bacterium]|nr:hypothetical protein [Armatimonadota bacterium]